MFCVDGSLSFRSRAFRFGLLSYLWPGRAGSAVWPRSCPHRPQTRTGFRACAATPSRIASDDGPLQLSLFDERDLEEITAPEQFPGERLIVCRKTLLAQERAGKREALLTATERDLARVQARRNPLRGAAK